MARKLTKKQRTFVGEYLEHGNGTKAALKAYDVAAPNTARSIATENLTKPAIRDALEEALSDELLAQKHKQLLEKRESYLGEATELIDANAVAKGLDMAYKLKGKYAPEKSISAHVDINELHAQIAQQIQLFQGTTEPKNE